MRESSPEQSEDSHLILNEALIDKSKHLAPSYFTIEPASV